ncbi:MAG TPA: PD-(D/E)XK nuclease family protein [Selenomonadales bacterium]|nr:PD-(D/E)XK nuclease family protein [Selenomonadales bacterium]
MHKLFCTPLDGTMREVFAGQLAEALRCGQGREAAMVLPSSYLLGMVRRGLREAGLAGHEQPNLLSFDDLVDDIVRRAGHRRHFMSRMTQELLVGQVLAKLTEAGELPYFGEIAAFPGYIGTVTSLLAEIKRTGASPDEFAAVAEAREWPQKDREIHAVYAAYQALLDGLGLVDLEEKYLLAVRELASGLELPYRRLYISEFYIFTPLQLEIVRQLRRGMSIHIGMAYERNRPEVFAAAEPTYTELVGMGFAPEFKAPAGSAPEDLRHLRRNLFAAQPESCAAADSIRLVGCPSRESEMETAAAQIKELLLGGSCRPEEVAVVVRDTGLYGSFREVGARFGIPVSLPREERLTDQPVVRVLLKAALARLEGGSRSAVVNLVKSPLIAEAMAIDADYLEKLGLTKLIAAWDDWFSLLDGGAGDEAKSGCRRGLDRLRRQIARLPLAGTCAEHAGAMKELLAGLEVANRLSGSHRQGQLSLQALKAGLLGCQRLDEILDAVAEGFSAVGQAGRVLPLAEYVKFLRQALAGETIKLEDYAAQGVRVVSPAGVRGASFAAVFVLGLAEGEFPVRERENWLFDDGERTILNGLGLSLPTAACRRAEERLYFAVATALAGERLTLCWHEDDQTLPSPFIEEVARLFAAASLRRDTRTAGQWFPEDYQAIYSPAQLTGRVLLDYCRSGTKPDERLAAAAEYCFAELLDADFCRRVEAEARRQNGGTGSFSGAVGPLAGDPAAGAEQYSITALESYAFCPFAYFAGRVLKLEEWAEKEEIAGMDVIGTVYHETLALFLRGHLGETLRPEREAEYWAELLGALEAASERLQGEGAIVPGPVWEYRRRHLAKFLRHWLEYEIGQQNTEGPAFTPAYLEWGFGLPLRPGMDAASVTVPLALECGGAEVLVTGKVDRIDRAGDKLAVIDYKRKYCPKFNELEAGTDLQAALYIQAAERFLGQAGLTVAGGGYYSIEACKKEGGMWRAELAEALPHRSARAAGNLTAESWDDTQAVLRRRIGDFVRGIRAGRFAIAPSGDCPRYCPGAEVCRYRSGSAQDAGGDGDG